MLVYKATKLPVKVGDKVPGKRMGKYYAHVLLIHSDCVELLYNGDVKSHKVPFHVIDAERLPEFPVEFLNERGKSYKPRRLFVMQSANTPDEAIVLVRQQFLNKHPEESDVRLCVPKDLC